MKIICEIGEKFPKTCDDCKLFVSELGMSPYCVVDGEYTDEEIEYILRVVPEVVRYLREISPVWEELEKGERPHLI